MTTWKSPNRKPYSTLMWTTHPVHAIKRWKLIATCTWCFDLFADPPADFDPQGEGRFDRSAWKNYEVMTQEQKSAWDAAYGPKNRALSKANLSGKDLVRGSTSAT